ncbi:MAG: hypothetical protein OFPII_21300 [Osedax symbiont Rs1]|nr:MAG: hypothetical protein OFPII_21300 [Osedax symbiont Rs1]
MNVRGNTIYKKCGQTGFSLIELMVALLIGMFMIGGIVSVFISSAQNYRMQRAVSEVQDNGRFVIQKLREDIQSAGFKVASTDNAIEYLDTTGSCESSVAALHIYTTSEEICYYRDSPNELKRKNKPSSGAWSTAVVIATGVRKIDYYFAVDSAGDDGKIDVVAGKVFRLASSLTAPNWVNVKAVKIVLVVSSTTDNVVDVKQQIKIVYNPVVNYPATDKKLHQAFTAIVPIKNRM